MPLARIVSDSAAEAAPLAARLRTLGYTVEIVSRQFDPVNPADVEISLERCDAAVAFAQAEARARELGADIYVTGGAAVASPRAQADPLSPGIPAPPAQSVIDLVRPAGAGPAASTVVTAALAAFQRLGESVDEWMSLAITAARNSIAGACQKICGQAASHSARVLRPAARLRIPGRGLSTNSAPWLAFAVAGAAAVAVVLGWSVVAGNPAPPELPSSSGIQQQVPFGPARTVPPAAVKPAALRSPQRAPTAVQAKTRRTYSADDDVVVHHYGAPKPPAKAQISSNGVRHISDQ